MKRILCLCLTLTMLLGLVACNLEEGDSTSDASMKDSSIFASQSGSISDSNFLGSVNGSMSDSSFVASVSGSISDSNYIESVNGSMSDSSFLGSVNDASQSAAQSAASGSASASASGAGSVSVSISASESDLLLNSSLGASSSLDDVIEEPGEALNGTVVVVDGVMQYEIVYEFNAQDQARSLIKELARLGVKHKDGRVFDEADFLSFCVRDTRIKNTYSPDTPQILLGTTLFDVSQEAAKDLRYRDYVVKRVGNKIIAVAGSTDVLTTAVSNYVVLGVRRLNGNTRSVMEKTYIANYNLKDVTICGVPLKDFTILYADGSVSQKRYGATTTMTYQDFAEEMQAKFQANYGYVLPIKKASSTAEGANEILIGPTNRALSSGVAAPGEQCYGMKTQGTQVALKCFGYSSYICLDDAFYNYLLRLDRGDGKIVLGAGVTHTALSGTIDQLSIPQATGSLRVMSYNVQSQLQGWMPEGMTAATVAERKETFYGLIKLAQADVIGFQEVTGGKGGANVTVANGKTSGSWAKELPTWMSALGYDTLFDTGHEYGNVSGVTAPPVADKKTTIISHNVISYNTKKFTKKAWGAHSYTNTDNAATRNFVWVLLEGNSGTALAGQRFIFISGHWDFADTTTGSRALQHFQGTELGNKINTLVKTYNCPVIAVADYNCPRDDTSINTKDNKPNNTALTNLMSTGQMEDTRPLAKANNGIRQSDINPGGCVDHILVRKTDKNGAAFGTDCVFFRVLAENGIGGISDHKPLLADIKLRG